MVTRPALSASRKKRGIRQRRLGFSGRRRRRWRANQPASWPETRWARPIVESAWPGSGVSQIWRLSSLNPPCFPLSPFPQGTFPHELTGFLRMGPGAPRRGFPSSQPRPPIKQALTEARRSVQQAHDFDVADLIANPRDKLVGPALVDLQMHQVLSLGVIVFEPFDFIRHL